MPEQDIETRELPCELNQTELLARGDAMADAELEIERYKLERSAVADKIKAKRAERRKLAGVVDTGVEQRDVRCVWIEDFAHNCYRLIRQDTGAEVDTRAMTAHDRQEGLFNVDEDAVEHEPRMRRHVDPDPDAPAAAHARRGMDA
jgi:hypothetical protein